MNLRFGEHDLEVARDAMEECSMSSASHHGRNSLEDLEIVTARLVLRARYGTIQ